MYIQSTIYLVDRGTATLQQSALYEGTLYCASVRVLQQLKQQLDRIEFGPSDDLESLVASVFCISHPDAHTELQKAARVLARVMHWWTWGPRPQWQRALTAARAANHGDLS